ncbi:MAG: CsgG/HfaB family protein [Thermodesulfobacteriota bacterium]
MEKEILIFSTMEVREMRTSNILFLILITLVIFLTFDFGAAQVIPPKARGTPSEGPTIEQAQKEEYMGPKARVAVSRFEDRSAKGKATGQIGDGMAEMLSNVLFATNRFIVLERQAIGDVLREQDLGASGRIRAESAARIGEIEGADLLIQGTITEFEPGTAGAGGGIGGALPGLAGIIGGVLASIRTSHVAMIVKVIDAKTSRLLASEQVEGKATDIGGLTGGVGGPLAGVFGGYSKTPMEKAIRVAIDEAVRIVVAKTPAEFYRVPATPQPQTTSATQTVSPAATTLSTPETITPTVVSPTPISPSSQPSSPQFSLKQSGSEPRIVYVKWPKVTLRDGPGTYFKALLEVKKGTLLAVLEEKEQWLRVSLEDGREGWVGKATVSETP